VYVPGYLQGLMVSGLFAVVISTADSWLNSMSLIVVNDVIKPLKPSLLRYSGIFSRLTIMGICACSYVVAGYVDDFTTIIWKIINFEFPTIAIPLFAGVAGFRTNLKSFIVALCVGGFASCSTAYFMGEFGVISCALGIIGNFSAYFITHYWQVKFTENFAQKYTSKFITIPAYPMLRHHVVWQLKQLREEYFKLFTNQTGKCVTLAVVISFYTTFTLLLAGNIKEDLFALTLAAVGYSCSLGLVLKEYLFAYSPKKKHFDNFWKWALALTFPLTGIYFMCKNNVQDVQYIYHVFSIFVVTMFADAKDTFKICVSGMIGGAALSYISEGSLSMEDISLSAFAIFVCAIKTIFALPKEEERKRQLSGMQFYTSAAAHEMKSPLASLSMFADTYAVVMNSALQNGSVCKKSESITVTFGKDEGNLLKLSVIEFPNSAKKSVNTMTEMLELNTKPAVNENEEKDFHSLAKTVKSAINQACSYYPDAENIEFSVTKNVIYEGSHKALKTVIFNLIKNSYVHNAPGVKIKLWIQGTTLCLKDNGKGISVDKLDSIFDPYTSYEGSSGVGLAFCRTTLNAMNASIKCLSSPGEGALFKIHFFDSIIGGLEV
jgi:signal transduction histidine kinase/uncharacterized membrane protein YeaQ/YmgE (transglycosylase-associated protein family)